MGRAGEGEKERRGEGEKGRRGEVVEFTDGHNDFTFLYM